jgi:TRAP-type C4-dicarboxylate transport system substrate-binding protein
MKATIRALPLAAILAFLAQPLPANATEEISLTAIDGYPPKSLWVKEFINFYIPAIDGRLAKTGNYKINWNQAWGGQIAKKKHVLEALQKGLGDIGVVTTVFHADKVPLQMVAYATPFVSTDPALVARTVDELAATVPAYKETWKKYNQVYLTNLAVLDSYQILSKDSIKSLADFEGKKIAGAGMNLRYLQGFGAAGVGGSLVTYYNKMKTGVVDGAMIWAEAAVTFKLAEVAPHMLRANIGTANSKAITMNADTLQGRRRNHHPDATVGAGQMGRDDAQRRQGLGRRPRVQGVARQGRAAKLYGYDARRQSAHSAAVGQRVGK